MLTKFARYPLTFGPTPIEKLDRLSAHLGGSVEIYAKREDCNSGDHSSECHARLSKALKAMQAANKKRAPSRLALEFGAPSQANTFKVAGCNRVQRWLKRNVPITLAPHAECDFPQPYP